ncbi:MAG: acetoacetate--CoA ligase [Acidimicrobiia bacterium]|nr:acetoacetate--CoA ligase [Acidimicrobiia bacterium]
MTSYGEVLWKPGPQALIETRIGDFMSWLAAGGHGPKTSTYQELWEWSVTDLEGFWAAIWDYFGVMSHSEASEVVSSPGMPAQRWFTGSTLNFAEHMLRRRDDGVAIISHSETRDRVEVTFAELAANVGAARAGLEKLGVEAGDRVAAYAPNIPETVTLMLATASLGAIWSSCAPEFGVESVVSRFQQIKPKVLFAVDGYVYGGTSFDKVPAITNMLDDLSVDTVVWLTYLNQDDPPFATISWDEFMKTEQEPSFTAVPFDHPLWVLYSSGTTGAPKGIVHGHGGITIELLKMHALHGDLGDDDRFFWFSTTGWMMWNYLISGLMVGASIVMYDGNPGYPSLMRLWTMAAEEHITYFGTSAPFLHACMQEGLTPGSRADLSNLRTIGSTGSPLSPEGFGWVYESVHSDLLLGSVSGGTDMCTAFVASSPLLPVRAGELQCRALGASVKAFNPAGEAVFGEMGELVITRPMPSMPIYFWNDPDGSKYRDAYFDVYPGVWRHGDWIKIEEDGSCVIFGRSDATLNRGGVRMGTSEFYRVVEALASVRDSVVVHTDDDRLLLFVVPSGTWTESDAHTLRSTLRRELSPRHVPDAVHIIDQVPRTLSGKKLEIPIKKILAGTLPDEAARLDALANPDSLKSFEAFRDP